jgi:hypothetical protein
MPATIRHIKKQQIPTISHMVLGLIALAVTAQIPAGNQPNLPNTIIFSHYRVLIQVFPAVNVIKMVPILVHPKRVMNVIIRHTMQAKTQTTLAMDSQLIVPPAIPRIQAGDHRHLITMHSIH